MHAPRSIMACVLIAFALACRTLTSPLPTPTAADLPTPPLSSDPLHFENQWVAFDYPAGLTAFEAGFEDPIWYPTVDFGGELVAGLGDARFLGFGKYYRSIRILRRSLPVGADFASVMDDVYTQTGAEHPWPLVDGALNLNGPITVDEHAAIQRSYRIYSGEPAYDLRDVWIRAGEDLYVASIATEWTSPEDLTAFEAMADKLLQGLKIKHK